MIRFLRHQAATDLILLLVAFGCLIVPAIQYPLSTTFPIGGDAAPHIGTVQNITSKPLFTTYTIARSWYPLSYALFSLNGFIPFVSWTQIYPWWMALGQILTGLAIGLLLFRLFGIRAAAIGIALWGITPIILTSFFEDATMAQLWSLPWLVLFFERLAIGSRKGMVLTFLFAVLSHPITGVIILLTVIITAPQLWIGKLQFNADEQVFRKMYSYSALAAILLALSIFASRYSIFFLSFRPESSRYLPELFYGFFFPWTIASIYGWYLIIHTYKERVILLVSLASFFFVSLLVAANHQFNIGFWTNRLNAYVTICIVIGASIGFSHMLAILRPKWISTLFASTMLLALTGSVFHDNQNIYKRSESLTNTPRISQYELQAITWIKENTPLSSNIKSSSATRHYEWISVLSGRSFNGETTSHTFIVFFTRQEKVPEHILREKDHYQLTYENKGAAIYRIMSL